MVTENFFQIDFKAAPGEFRGFVLINKDKGMNSHTVVNRLRRLTGVKRIGHAGTLDPLASGLMIVAISREATRELDQFIKLDKEYIATIYLGAETDTYDAEGEIKNRSGVTAIDRHEIEEKIKKFLGELEQIPPMFSAKKIQGKKLYELARRGIEVERKPSRIRIDELEIIFYEFPILKLRVACSSGTYIRSLAYDLGRSLGCGAYLEDLQRTKVGDFKLSEAISLEEFERRVGIGE